MREFFHYPNLKYCVALMRNRDIVCACNCMKCETWISY